MLTNFGKKVVQGGAYAGGKLLGAGGKAFDLMNKVLLPLSIVGFPAYGVASGEMSLGEGIGDAVGSQAGFVLADKGISKLRDLYNARLDAQPPTKYTKFKRGAGAVGFMLANLAGGLGGSMIGSSLLSPAFNKVLPYKRQPDYTA